MDLTPANLGLAGLAAAVIAVIAWFGDHRRHHRNDPDAVGFMNWTAVFFLALFTAVLLLGAAARMWLAG